MHKLSKLVIDDKKSQTGDYPMPSSGKETKEDEMRRRRYRAEDALRCLIRAEEIKRDKQLMADIRVVAADQAKKAQEQLNKAKKF